MPILKVTIVGQEQFKIATEIFESVGLNPANQVSTGMLGNLKTLTYDFDISEEEVIEKRKALMNAMADDDKRLMPMYMHRNWMRVFVFKPIKE